MAEDPKTAREIDIVARAIHENNRDWVGLDYDQVFNDAERMADAAIKTLDRLRRGQRVFVQAPTSTRAN